jgi:hypothetical protein
MTRRDYGDFYPKQTYDWARAGILFVEKMRRQRQWPPNHLIVRKRAETGHPPKSLNSGAVGKLAVTKPTGR